jgi:hypothetical protein
VQSDVDERARKSRKKLEAKIKGVLREASEITHRALVRARITQAAGAPAVAKAQARLDAFECEVRSFLSSSPRILRS